MLCMLQPVGVGDPHAWAANVMNMRSKMRNSHVTFLSTSIIITTLITRQWEWDRHPRLILSDLILHLHLHKPPMVD